MKCGNCGAALVAGAGFCGSCGASAATADGAAPIPVAAQPVPAPSRHPAPSTTMPIVLAIITTSCCCLPLGVVGIVFAVQASSAVSSGDYAAAEDAIRKSKMWSMIGMAVGGVAILAYVGIFVVAAMNQ